MHRQIIVEPDNTALVTITTPLDANKDRKGSKTVVSGRFDPLDRAVRLDNGMRVTLDRRAKRRGGNH